MSDLLSAPWSPETPDASDASSPRLQRLHPATFFVALFGIVRRFLIPGLIVIFLGSNRGELFFMWFSIPAFLGALIQYLSVRFTWTETHLLVRQGLFDRSLRRIPFHKIQSLEIHRTLVHRIFGVEDVIVHTGSGGEPEAVLSTLSTRQVEEIREQLQEFRREDESGQADEAQEPTSDDAGASPRLAPLEEDEELRCGHADLLAYGLLGGRGYLLLAVAFGAFWQFDIDLPDFGSGTATFLYEQWQVFPLLAVVLVPLFLALLWTILHVFSALWAWITLHGFQVATDGDRIDLRFGLLVHRAMTVPGRRLHVIEIEESPLHRLFGKVTLTAWTASGWDEGDGEDFAEINELFKTLVLHPFAVRGAAQRLVERLTGESSWDELPWRDLDPRALNRKFLRRCIWILPIAAAGTVLAFPWGLFAGLALLAVGAWNAWAEARFTKYAITPHGVWQRRGFFYRKWRMVGHGHVQVVATAQSPFDRRKDFASLHVDAPSAPMGEPAIAIADLSLEDAVAARDELGNIAARHSLSW